MGIFWQIQLESKFVQYPRVFLIRVLPELILQLTFIAFLSFCQILSFYLFARFFHLIWKIGAWSSSTRPPPHPSSSLPAPSTHPAAIILWNTFQREVFHKEEEALTSMDPQEPSKTFQTLMIQEIWASVKISGFMKVSLRYYRNLFGNVALGRCSTLLWGHRACVWGRWGGQSHLSIGGSNWILGNV